MTLNEFRRQKEKKVVVYRDDLFHEEDDPDWMKNHKLGPVHIQIRCTLCNKILFRDLKEYGWLENDSFYEKKLVPHLLEHIELPIPEDYSI